MPNRDFLRSLFRPKFFLCCFSPSHILKIQFFSFFFFLLPNSHTSVAQAVQKMMEEEEEDPLWSPRQSRNNSKGRKKSAAGKRSRRASATSASRKGGEAKIRTGYGSACNICRTDHRGCDGQRPCFRCVKVGCAVRYLFFCCGVVIFSGILFFLHPTKIQSQLRWFVGILVCFYLLFFIFIFLFWWSLLSFCVGLVVNLHTRSFLSIGYRVDRGKKVAPRNKHCYISSSNLQSSELILFFNCNSLCFLPVPFSHWASLTTKDGNFLLQGLGGG